MGAAAAIGIVLAGAEIYSSSQNKPKAPKIPPPPASLAGGDKAPDYTGLDAQRKQRALSGGRDSTILTGPLGLPPPSAATKTILGG